MCVCFFQTAKLGTYLTKVEVSVGPIKVCDVCLGGFDQNDKSKAFSYPTTILIFFLSSQPYPAEIREAAKAS